MNLQPTLEDDLIIIRPLKESDFDLLYSVAKDPLIWEQHPSNDRYKKTVFTEFFKDSLKSRGALIIFEKSSTKVIGITRFKPIHNVESVIEIGWSFF